MCFIEFVTTRYEHYIHTQKTGQSGLISPVRLPACQRGCDIGDVPRLQRVGEPGLGEGSDRGFEIAGLEMIEAILRMVERKLGEELPAGDAASVLVAQSPLLSRPDQQRRAVVDVPDDAVAL